MAFFRAINAGLKNMLLPIAYEAVGSQGCLCVSVVTTNCLNFSFVLCFFSWSRGLIHCVSDTSAEGSRDVFNAF